MQSSDAADANRLRRLPAPWGQKPRGHAHRCVGRPLRQRRQAAAVAGAISARRLRCLVLRATEDALMACCGGYSHAAPSLAALASEIYTLASKFWALALSLIGALPGCTMVRVSALPG